MGWRDRSTATAASAGTTSPRASCATRVVGPPVFGAPTATRLGKLVFPGPTASPAAAATATKLYRSPALRLVYSVPPDWSPSDYTLSPSTPLQEVVVARISADLAT